VGEGYHRGAGFPHAEVEALSQAGSAASGGTAVVTLEPCHHMGHTGPCTSALVDAGVSKVVFAQADPNPVAQGGSAALTASGVVVESGVLVDLARALNPTWTFAMERARPFVTWKVASTVDGLVAAADGSSRWITGEAARAEVHDLRAAVNAVMVGTGTVVVDDPQLTARAPDGRPVASQPLRVVVGERDLPTTARVLDQASETVQLRTHEPVEALAELFTRDVHHVLLEGGPTLAAAFVGAGLVDRAIGYVAPALLGDGQPMIASLGRSALSEAVRFGFDDVRLVGDDLRWTGRLSYPPEVNEQGMR